MMYEGIIGGVIAIIGVAIILGVGSSILGSTANTFNCETLQGYNSGTPASSTGWAKTCLDANEQSRNAWVLIPVVMIVIAAVIILGVLRAFG